MTIARKLRVPFRAWRTEDASKPQTFEQALPLEPRADAGGSLRWWKGGAIALLAVIVIAPKDARGQFGFDTAAILLSLEHLQSLMSSEIAKPLQGIQQIEASVQKYEQQIVYPLAQINQARQSVLVWEKQAQQITTLFHLNFKSATLPQSQALETTLVSQDPNNVAGVGDQFQAVYGPVMAQNTASPATRNMTDLADAEAQDAMKRAIAIDSLADLEIAQADALGKQIQTAAPGSAPILEAEADVWLVRANAYTQSAIAELQRIRAVDLANESASWKQGAAQNVVNGKMITNTLTSR